VGTIIQDQDRKDAFLDQFYQFMPGQMGQNLRVILFDDLDLDTELFQVKSTLDIIAFTAVFFSE
jgi:hypothetical protein